MNALVLAGRREGRIDPLAEAYGLTDKCRVPLDGKPLIVHVLDALTASPLVGVITVSVNDPDSLSDLDCIQTLHAAQRLQIVRSSASLFDSIVKGARHAGFPLLVTTADNVFLSPAAIVETQTQAQAAGADAAVAFARKANILAVHPDGQRRFYGFADDAYSNCNTYWLASPAALTAANSFRGGGQFAKHPMRIIQAFGITNLIRFRFGIGTLDAAFRRFSKKLGMTIHPVVLDDGAVAIDVDNSRTHAIAEDIRRTRSLV